MPRLPNHRHPLRGQLDHVRLEGLVAPASLELHQHDQTGGQPVCPVKFRYQSDGRGNPEQSFHVNQIGIPQRCWS